MKPTQLQYERLVSDREYGNVKLGLVVELGPDDDVDNALAMMKRTVHSALFWTLMNAGIDATEISIGEGCPDVEIFHCGHCCKAYPIQASHPTETEESFLNRRLCASCGQNAIAERKRREAAEQEEALRSASREVTINGERHQIGFVTSYRDLIRRAFPDATTPPPLMSVTYHTPDGRDGSLCPDEELDDVQEGTIFNVAYTG